MGMGFGGSGRARALSRMRLLNWTVRGTVEISCNSAGLLSLVFPQVGKSRAMRQTTIRELIYLHDLYKTDKP